MLGFVAAAMSSGLAGEEIVWQLVHFSLATGERGSSERCCAWSKRPELRPVLACVSVVVGVDGVVVVRFCGGRRPCVSNAVDEACG